jgi:hypothetical protein
MTGIPQFNIPAFDSLADHMRRLGHDVISPAELDGPKTRQILWESKTGSKEDLPDGETWGFYLGRDVQMLCDDGIEGVVCLPGWDKSPGARLETFVASAILGKPIFIWSRVGLINLTVTALARAWIGDGFDNIILPTRGADHGITR